MDLGGQGVWTFAVGQLFEIAGFVVWGAGLPAFPKDPDPFKGQGAQDGVVFFALGPHALIIDFGPGGEDDGLPGPLDKALAQEAGSQPAPADMNGIRFFTESFEANRLSPKIKMKPNMLKRTPTTLPVPLSSTISPFLVVLPASRKKRPSVLGSSGFQFDTLRGIAPLTSSMKNGAMHRASKTSNQCSVESFRCQSTPRTSSGRPDPGTVGGKGGLEYSHLAEHRSRGIECADHHCHEAPKSNGL
jgi:hypothetical protein